VLAYDADGAGQAAAERFYEWERIFEIDIVVAALPRAPTRPTLPAGTPTGSGAITGLSPTSPSGSTGPCQRADLRAPEGRARAAAAAMAIVSEHPNELVRDQYLMLIADRCQIDPGRLRTGAWRSWAPAPPRSGRAGCGGGRPRACAARRPRTGARSPAPRRAPA